MAKLKMTDQEAEDFLRKMRKLGTEQLKKRIPRLDGEEKEIAKSVLSKRKRDAVADEEAAKEIDLKNNPEKKNVGKQCSFVPFRQSDELDGTILAFVNDRRVSRRYYKIKALDGKIYHKKTKSEQLTIH